MSDLADKCTSPTPDRKCAKYHDVAQELLLLKHVFSQQRLGEGGHSPVSCDLLVFCRIVFTQLSQWWHWCDEATISTIADYLPTFILIKMMTLYVR